MNNGTVRNPSDLLVVTGISGAGKSTTVKYLEDLGYYCIDNLPIILIMKILELMERKDERFSRIALGIDIREKTFFGQVTEILDELNSAGTACEILFLEANTPALVKRYSETRRKHPLAKTAGLIASIEEERTLLTALRKRAARIIDTSDLTIHELKSLITGMYGDGASGIRRLAIQILSFGYKNGMPIHADMVFDTRFLPNPYYIAELKSKTGNDPDVYNFVLKNDRAQAFIRRLKNLLMFLIPQFEKEQKSYLTIAVGCTGGMHRSVAVANDLYSFLKKKRYPVTVEYRDIGEND
ncbi:RNase adapter RapZ [candidate division KSB1 bacterium]